MQDHLIRATTPGGVRAFAAITTNLTEEARKRHDCYPVATAALGRTMTASLLLAANLKTDESITVRIVGEGPLGEVIADASATGNVRGYVKNPQIDLPLNQGKLNVGTAVGQGYIHVTRFTGLRQPFTGSAKLISGEIAEDVTQYLYVSEQTPSSVALGVLVKPDLSVWSAGGFMIQALPNAEADVLDIIEENLSLLPPVSQLVKDGNTGADILRKIFGELPLTLYETNPLQFKCTCNWERVEAMLVSLGEKEVISMLEEGKAEVTCHFCNEKHYFNTSQLQMVLDTIRQK